MKKKNEKYDKKAFISYRHPDPDDKLATEMDYFIAKSLVKIIEEYRIPKDIKKSLNLNKYKVFRDKEELNHTNDLSDELKRKIDEFEYFIIVGSPRYKESEKFCLKEYEHFLSRYPEDSEEKTKKIIPVLAWKNPESETNENPVDSCFPVGLFPNGADDAYVVRLDVDVKNDFFNIKKKIIVWRKLKDESAGIVANMTDNCDKAMLKNRFEKRRKRNRIIAALTALIVAIAIIFGVTSHYRSLQISQSKYLATKSEEAYNNGDVKNAVKLALQALPKSQYIKNKPYVPEAEAALSKALGVYKNEYQLEKSFTHNTGLWNDIYVSENEDIFIQFDYDDNMVITNLENEEKSKVVSYDKLFKKPYKSNEFIDKKNNHYDYCGFIDDKIVICSQRQICCYDITNDKVLSYKDDFNESKYFALSNDKKTLYSSNGGAFYKTKIENLNTQALQLFISKDSIINIFDDKVLIDKDDILELYDLKTDKFLWSTELTDKHNSYVFQDLQSSFLTNYHILNCAFQLTDDTIVYCDSTQFQYISSKTGKILARHPITDNVIGACVMPDSNSIAFANSSGKFMLVDCYETDDAFFDDLIFDAKHKISNFVYLKKKNAFILVDLNSSVTDVYGITENTTNKLIFQPMPFDVNDLNFEYYEELNSCVANSYSFFDDKQTNANKNQEVFIYDFDAHKEIKYTHNQDELNSFNHYFKYEKKIYELFINKEKMGVKDVENNTNLWDTDVNDKFYLTVKLVTSFKNGKSYIISRGLDKMMVIDAMSGKIICENNIPTECGRLEYNYPLINDDTIVLSNYDKDSEEYNYKYYDLLTLKEKNYMLNNRKLMRIANQHNWVWSETEEHSGEVFDLETGEQLTHINTRFADDYIYATKAGGNMIVEFSPDDKYLIFKDNNGYLMSWDVKKDRLVFKFSENLLKSNDLYFSTDSLFSIVSYSGHNKKSLQIYHFDKSNGSFCKLYDMEFSGDDGQKIFDGKYYLTKDGISQLYSTNELIKMGNDYVDNERMSKLDKLSYGIN